MENQAKLEVTSLTWNRDTHGLFDYESKSLLKHSFKIYDSCIICRHKDDCFIKENDDHIGLSNLIGLEKRGNEYQVSLLDDGSLNKLWLVVKDIKKKSSFGYKLNEGDWLKLGRVKIRIQKICLKPLRSSNTIIPEFFKKNNEQIEDVENETEQAENQEKSPCRICLMEESTPENPLICPCNCSGTVKFIHINCLKEWLKSKISSKITEKGMSFHIKDLTCELCKSDFPSLITYKNQKISLLNITYPDKSFVIIEELRPERNIKHALHFLSLDKGQIGTLGRGHDCDIKISDISVSRKHCKMFFDGDSFYIDDSKSKFGTLAKMKKSFNLKASYDVTIQVNRTVFRLNYKVPWACKDLCCFKRSKVHNASLSYLTQPEGLESESELVNISSSLPHQVRSD